MVRLLIAFIIFPSVWSFSLENSSSSSFNSLQALKLLQHRIENLEEPGRFMNNRNCTTAEQKLAEKCKKCVIKQVPKLLFFLVTVWKVSKESNRWERCDETTQCSCNAVMKYVECIVNGSLYGSLTMPWDVEVMYVLHDV